MPPGNWTSSAMSAAPSRPTPPWSPPPSRLARTCWSPSSRRSPATTSSCAAPKTNWPWPAATSTTSARPWTSPLAKFKAGRATELDTARARAQLDATLALIPPLEAAVKHSIYRLSVLTGQQPTALESELAPPAPIPALPPLVNIGNPADLLRRRPDIRSAESSLAAATARIGVETADLFPRVTFNGNLGVQASQFSGLVQGRRGHLFLRPQHHLGRPGPRPRPGPHQGRQRPRRRPTGRLRKDRPERARGNRERAG